MTDRARAPAGLLALGLVACAEPGPGPGAGDGGGFSVLRDCPPDAGTICPYAGTGANGWNGDGLDRLDTWLSNPMQIEFSPYGDPILADWNNHRLRRIAPDGTVTTVMGTSFLGDGDFDLRDLSEGAPGTEVNLNHPTQQRYLPDGTLMSASWHTHKIRTWDPFGGLVRVLVGGVYGFNPPESDPPGSPQDAVGMLLNQPVWLEVDREGDLWIVDMRNERIRELDMAGFTIRTVAGSGLKGIAGTREGGVDCTSEVALEACFALPNDDNPQPGGALQLDEEAGLAYVSDSEAHCVRVLDLAAGTLRPLAGRCGEPGDAVGPLADLRLDFPTGLALDRDAGVLFVADTDNHRVVAIDLAAETAAVFAGTGEPTCASEVEGAAAVCPEQARGGDGGPATEATLFRPFGVALDLDGDVVISDTFDHRLRIVSR